MASSTSIECSELPEAPATNRARGNRTPVYRMFTLNLRTLSLIAGFAGCIMGGFWAFMLIDSFWKLPLSAFSLTIAGMLFYLLLREPIKVKLAEHLVQIRYPFHSAEFEYREIERLFYHKRASSSNPASGQAVLRIRLINGRIHRITSISNSIRQMTRQLESRVYGPTIS